MSKEKILPLSIIVVLLLAMYFIGGIWQVLASLMGCWLGNIMINFLEAQTNDK
jgi:hypothetical protein